MQASWVMVPHTRPGAFILVTQQFSMSRYKKGTVSRATVLAKGSVCIVTLWIKHLSDFMLQQWSDSVGMRGNSYFTF